MSEFSESFFESVFLGTVIIDFCVISSEACFLGGGCSDFNNFVLCAIMISIMSFLFLSSSFIIFPLQKENLRFQYFSIYNIMI